MDEQKKQQEITKEQEKQLLKLKNKELVDKARYLTKDDSYIKESLDKNGKLNLTKLEKLVKDKEEEIDKAKQDFLYPSDMRESWERMGSQGLKLNPIPGIRRRFINTEARAKSGTNKFWKLDPRKHRVTIGDLTSAYVPEEMAIEKKKRERKQESSSENKRGEERKELANSVFRDSGGEINLVVDGHDPSKALGKRKTYFYSK